MNLANVKVKNYVTRFGELTYDQAVYITHTKFKLLYSQTETRKRSILIKTGTKFCTKNECALVAQVHSDLCAIFSNNATMAQGAWLS